MSRRLQLSITAQSGREMVPFLRSQLIKAHALLDKPPRRLRLGDLSIALVSDKQISALHQEFMSIAGPTDVMTFPIDQDARGRVTSGEVVICVPFARREAKQRKISPRLEVLLYALHGMLHLLGYDDRTDRAYHTMHRTEDELLSKLGLGPVFARPPASPSSPKPAARTRKGAR